MAGMKSFSQGRGALCEIQPNVIASEQETHNTMHNNTNMTLADEWNYNSNRRKRN